MLISRFLLLSALPLALAACADVAPKDEIVVIDAPATLPEGDSCGATALQQYVGQTSPQISLPAGTVFRHYRTGDPVTMDFAPTRVNFEYDRSGKLVKVSCG